MIPEKEVNVRYRVFGCTIDKITPDLFLIHSEKADRLHVITASQAEILFSCEHFNTLDAHALHYCDHLKQKKTERFTGVFGSISRYFLDTMLQQGSRKPVTEKETEPILIQLMEFVESGYLIAGTEAGQKSI